MKCTQSVSESSRKTNIFLFDIRLVRSPFKFDIPLKNIILEIRMEENIKTREFRETNVSN